jgi:uncharacterized protein (DUF488 family)
MSVVYTIGYERTDIDRFIATLKSVGVKQLADVRAIAVSRKKGFSKKSLAARLDVEGIEYLHFIELGDPKLGREAARAGRYNEFRAIYGAHFDSNEAQASFQKLLTTVRKQPTCLLCFERDPVTCHRSIVAERIAKNGYQIFDLYGDDPDRYIRNRSKLPGGRPGEGAAAAQ